MNTFRIDLHRMSKTPPPQTFSPSHGDWHNQATSQQRYHDPFSEQVVSPWQRDHYSDDRSNCNAGFWNAHIGGSGPTQNIPLNDGSSPSSLEQSSQHSSADSYGSSNTSHSQPGTTGSGSIDPRFMQSTGKHIVSYLTSLPTCTRNNDLIIYQPFDLTVSQSTRTKFLSLV